MPIDPRRFPGARAARLAALWAVCLTAAAQEPRTVHYDWLTAGEVSGSQVLKIGADGARTADFEFNDRGRGPKIHEELTFAADGTPRLTMPILAAQE